MDIQARMKIAQMSEFSGQNNIVPAYLTSSVAVVQIFENHRLGSGIKEGRKI